MNVIIIGAGLGGLCLAQSLKRAGVGVSVFERDEAPEARRQGYRLHLDADGVAGLRAALPEDRFALFEATSMVPLRYTTILGTDFAIRRRFVTDEYSRTTHHLDAGIATHLNVDRATLREILLLGLEDVVRFGKALTHYESGEDGVTACFNDGSRVRGDLLVGADGAASAVRRQRHPQAPWMDSGARSIYGRLDLDVARRLLPPSALADVFTGAADERKLLLGVGPVIYPMRPELAAAALTPGCTLSPRQDYVGCIIAGRKEHFGDDATLRTLDSVGLQRLAARLLSGWPAPASDVVLAAQPESFFYIEMRSSIPTTFDRPTNVTLLGDAVHTMTPSLGRGANVALRDAASLGQTILTALRSGQPMADALAGYEAEMQRYGFDVVRHSADMGARLLGQDPLPDA
ncbi:FAD-dependent oxidoreductase [Nitrospirillum iridis]|uniref:2-polyprenyl-6-methoxyphenol hydroxylase-like FAD-dependent oxidoreductase n=1 Tax=Nitrospirillum iridis TaxID=765888 RepID=A0A7X0AW60_9PROT|nr:NAD(P)/FAD-dependent oxidoreductase [Nitrospirillum iridis]MBB6250195.1 2-polyprenyl-6-methoxyphenol hydroxylase-like FAD-dependent oxidoreductase [Nitrospirillum iridis]